MPPVDLLRTFALALCTWREGRGEPLLGKLLIAQTVENRVRDSRWPDTYVGVITQPLQFSAFNKGDANALLYPAENDAAWPDCVAAAQFVIDAPSVLTKANHYCTKDSQPAWRDDKKLTITAGNHVFFVL